MQKDKLGTLEVYDIEKEDDKPKVTISSDYARDWTMAFFIACCAIIGFILYSLDKKPYVLLVFLFVGIIITQERWKKIRKVVKFEK